MQKSPDQQLNAEYELALEKGRDLGLVGESLAQGERRTHVRVNLATGREFAQSESSQAVLNVSARGILVLARQALRQADRVHLVAADDLTVVADVVDCRFAEFDHEAMATHYRISCSFVDVEQGKRLVIKLMKEQSKEILLLAPENN